MQFRFSRRLHAFTLIELIVVMGILAILATIVIIAVNPARQFASSRNAKRVSDTRALAMAINQHAADNNGQLLTGITTVPKTIGTTAGATFIDLTSALVPNYISAIPTDPTGGTTSNTKYVVYLSANQVIVSGVGENAATISSDGMFTPLQIADLKLWLKADSGTFQTSGGASALADTDPIGEWQDLSGGAYHAVQNTAANKPALRLNIKNGRPIVRFDGVNDSFLSALTTGNSSYTVFLAFNEPGSDGNSRFFLAGCHFCGGGTTPLRLQTHSSNNPTRVSWIDTGIKEPLTLASGWQLLEWYLPAGGTGEIVRNAGSASATAAYSAVSLLNNTTLGADPGGAAFISADIAEIIVFNRALSTTERAQVRLYLNSRWALY